MRVMTLAAVLLCGCGAGCPSLKAADDAVLARLEKLEKRQDAMEKKVEGYDAKLDAILAAVAPKKPAVLTGQAPIATPPKTLRAAIGHTHTCVNGHTWDHSMDGGSHICPFCGLLQDIVDSAPKAVLGSVQPLQYGIGSAASSGCANGQCAAPQRIQRRGLFRIFSR